MKAFGRGFNPFHNTGMGPSSGMSEGFGWGFLGRTGNDSRSVLKLLMEPLNVARAGSDDKRIVRRAGQAEDLRGSDSFIPLLSQKTVTLLLHSRGTWCGSPETGYRADAHHFQEEAFR